MRPPGGTCGSASGWGSSRGGWWSGPGGFGSPRRISSPGGSRSTPWASTSKELKGSDETLKNQGGEKMMGRFFVILVLVSFIGSLKGQTDPCGRFQFSGLTGVKDPDFTAVILSNGRKFPLAEGRKGETVRLSQIVGDGRLKGVVLNFVSVTCPFCERQLPAFIRALKRFKGKGVVVITVYIDRDRKVIQKALKGRKFPMPVLWDKQREGVKTFKIRMTPTVVVLNGKGKVIATYAGMIPPDPDNYARFLSVVLQAIANGAPLPPMPMGPMMMGQG